MTRKTRIIVGVLILLISIFLLIWANAPIRHETRIQNISPSEMQLPVPASYQMEEELRVAFNPRLDL